MSTSAAGRTAKDAPRRADPSAAPAERKRYGAFALIVLMTGIGLLICSYVNGLSRAAETPSLLPYWGGILLIAVPIFYRLTGRQASLNERLLLVCLLGLSLYLVKVMRDSPFFTFSDEMVHAYNLNQIVASGSLFGHNPILKITPLYPGLEGATSALVKLTGLGAYPAGVIFVGVARILMLAALFLLFARVSGSARAAGVGVGIYAGNFNFLYWGAQFSYESLSLPLLLVVMMALAERESAPREALRSWGAPILIATAAIVVTHHISSYALVGFLGLLSLAFWYVRRGWSPPNPWPFALFALVLSLGWLFIVASATVGYLTPVLSNAVEAIANTAGGSSPPRSLFEGEGPTIEPAPLAAKGLTLLAVVLLAAGLPLGLREIWRHHMRKPFALLFSIAAVGFFGTLALRLAPPAWETGNRASEFLFIGLAFVLACGCVALLGRFGYRPLARLGIALAVAWVLIGGAIGGWPWDSQLARPMQISAGGRTLPSASLSAAEWARREVDGGRFAASHADAGIFLVPGEKWAMSGSAPDVEDILDNEALSNWELPLLRRNGLRYVVADLRQISNDTVRGHFFIPEGSATGALKKQLTTTKFNKLPRVSRLYSNGWITVFDTEGRPR